MQSNLTPNDNRHCPVYNRMIDGELCYESCMCLGRMFKIESVPELNEIINIDEARKICEECPHSNME